MNPQTQIEGEPLQAYSYLRISSPEQLLGDGIRRQLDATNAYCLEKGLLLETRPLTDLGLSGFHGKNVSEGALGAFMKAVQAGNGKIKTPCALVVEKLDRLTRQNISTAVTLLLALIDSGVEVHTVMDREVYRIGEMDMKKFLISIVTLSRGHEESQTKSNRIIAAWIEKRKHAHKKILTRICPGWLKPREDLSGFDEIPERVAVVREIFELTAAGHSKAKIAAMLNERKEPMWGIKEKNKSLRWYDTYVNALLKGRTVLGELKTCQIIGGIRTYSLEPIKDYYPRIISLELYQQANISNAAKLQHRVVYPDPDAPRNLVQGLVWLNGAKATWKNRGCRRNHVWKRPRKNLAPRYWIYFIVKEPSTGNQLYQMPREIAESMIVGRLLTLDPSDLAVAPEVDARVSRRNILIARIEEFEVGIARMVSAIKSANMSDAPGAILQQMTADERALGLAKLELRKLEASYNDTDTLQKSIPKDLDAIRELALKKDDPVVREQLIRHLGDAIARVDLATAPELLPEWCREGAIWMSNAFTDQGGDRGYWCGITLRDGTQIAGAALPDGPFGQMMTLVVNPNPPAPGPTTISFGADSITLGRPL